MYVDVGYFFAPWGGETREQENGGSADNFAGGYAPRLHRSRCRNALPHPEGVATSPATKYPPFFRRPNRISLSPAGDPSGLRLRPAASPDHPQGRLYEEVDGREPDTRGVAVLPSSGGFLVRVRVWTPPRMFHRVEWDGSRRAAGSCPCWQVEIASVGTSCSKIHDRCTIRSETHRSTASFFLQIFKSS